MKQIPLGGKLGKGKFAVVDDSDYSKLVMHGWSIDSTGYPQACCDGKKVRMHNFLLGKSCRDKQIDHKDRDKLNNQRSNLRFVTHKENNNNKDENVFIEAFGENKTLCEWARDHRCSISYVTIQYRLKNGFSNEDAISLPNRNISIQIDDKTIFNLYQQYNNFNTIAKILKLKRKTISYRYYRYIKNTGGVQ